MKIWRELDFIKDVTIFAGTHPYSIPFTNTNTIRYRIITRIRIAIEYAISFVLLIYS